MAESVGRPKKYTENVTRTLGRFEPANWEKFTEALGKRGSTVQAFMDQVVTNVATGNYISVNQLRPEILGELRREAEEEGLSVEQIVTSILAKYLRAKLEERKAARAK